MGALPRAHLQHLADLLPLLQQLRLLDAPLVAEAAQVGVESLLKGGEDK